jgi:hypothetical protein
LTAQPRESDHRRAALLDDGDEIAALLDDGDEIAALLDDGDEIAFLDDVAFGDLDAHRSGRLGDHRDLHLHGLQDHQSVAVFDLLALGHDDLPDVRHQFGTDFLGHQASLRCVISIKPAAFMITKTARPQGQKSLRDAEPGAR